MLTIHKYHILAEDKFAIRMPVHAKILSLQCQGNEIVMWAVVDTEAQMENRFFRLAGTGHPLDGVQVENYIGTVQQSAFCWHVFENKS